MRNRKKQGKAGHTARSLSDDDILTRRPIGRRSALSLIGSGVIGSGVIGGGAIGLAPRLARAQVGDGTDVTRQGDAPADNDSGPNADPAGDSDISVLADSAAGFDNDVARVGDTGDNDSGPFADTGDNDVTTLADPKSTRPSDPADIDVSSRGDPLPENIDVDPTDPAGDADQSVRGDVADQD